MANQRTEILTEVAAYYTSKLAEYDDSPRGVDWNGIESQIRRFEQLGKVVHCRDGFSINDLGCGYGALIDYLNMHYSDFDYTGYDISVDMIRTAETRFSGQKNAGFINAAEPSALADYGIASGIFNVRLARDNTEWYRHIEVTLDALNRTSRKGFSFNCLTSYSDSEKMKDYLYYADPCALFNLCKRRYSLNVALLHDYDLYEFTILVRKEL